MQVRLLVPRVGPGGSFNRGDIIDVDPDEATRMAAKGQAEVLRVKPVERAVKRTKPEKAVK